MANPDGSKYTSTWMKKNWFDFISIFFENDLVQVAPLQGQHVASEVFTIMRSILEILGIEEATISDETIAQVEQYLQNFTTNRTELEQRYKQTISQATIAQYQAEGVKILSFDELMSLIPYPLNVHLGTNIPAISAKK